MSTGEATEMRLLLPARKPQRGLLREHISAEPVSLAVLGFDVRHGVAAQADVRPNGRSAQRPIERRQLPQR